MSSYTTAILTCFILDGCKVRELDAILEAYDTEPFSVSADGEAWTSTANYMPCTDIIEAISSIEWNSPQHVQLFLRSEHDDHFSEVELKLRGEPEFTYFGTDREDGSTEWQFTRTRPLLPPAVDFITSLLGEADPLAVHLVVASRVSGEARDKFVASLSDEDRERLSEIITKLESATEGK